MSRSQSAWGRQVGRRETVRSNWRLCLCDGQPQANGGHSGGYVSAFLSGLVSLYQNESRGGSLGIKENTSNFSTSIIRPPLIWAWAVRCCPMWSAKYVPADSAGSTEVSTSSPPVMCVTLFRQFCWRLSVHRRAVVFCHRWSQRRFPEILY